MKLFLFGMMVVFMFEIAQADTTKRYIKVSGGYLMVLREGDQVFKHLEELARKENIKSATFSGIGFANVKFGFFDFKTKEYVPKEFKKIELASFKGSIAWEEGKPSLHAHGVGAGENFQAVAGHILEATVDTGSLEIRVELMDKKLNRKVDESLGAKILEIP